MQYQDEVRSVLPATLSLCCCKKKSFFFFFVRQRAADLQRQSKSSRLSNANACMPSAFWSLVATRWSWRRLCHRATAMLCFLLFAAEVGVGHCRRPSHTGCCSETDAGVCVPLRSLSFLFFSEGRVLMLRLLSCSAAGAQYSIQHHLAIGLASLNKQ